MVTFVNERAVEILLDRAAKLRRCNSLKHIFIMKDRPRSERPDRNESNTLTEAADGSNANRGGNNRAPQTRTATTPNRRTPNARDQQPMETGVTPNRRTSAPNSRTPNGRNQQTGNGASPVARLFSRGMDLVSEVTASAVNLLGPSPRNSGRRQSQRTRGNTEPPNRARNTGTSTRDGQQNVQSGNGEGEVQIKID